MDELDFVKLSTPLIELVMRVRASLVAPDTSLKTTIILKIKNIEEYARKARYPEDQIQSVKYALSAYCDEMILDDTLDINFDPQIKIEWQGRPVQYDFFDNQLAGELFYNQLNQMINDPDKYGSVLEIYYMCLILGLHGKFKYHDSGNQRKVIINELAETLRRANRLREGSLSGNWRLTDQPPLPHPPPEENFKKYLIITLSVVGVWFFLSFIFFQIALLDNIRILKDQVLR